VFLVAGLTIWEIYVYTWDMTDDNTPHNHCTEFIAYKPKKNEKFLPEGNLKARPVEQQAFPHADPEPFYEPHDEAKAHAINERAKKGRSLGLRGMALVNWIASGQWLRSEVKRYLKS
jgi:hypothetical protein